MLLTVIQVFHTFITYLNFSALFYMIYMHWNNKRGRLLYIAYGLIAVEVAVILAFNWTCPVRLWITEHYSSSTPDQIILNNVAHYYLKAGTLLLGIAVATYFIRRKSLGNPKP